MSPRLLIATDAWEPQVNGVVRTLQSTVRELTSRGVSVRVVHPGGFQTVALPSYPDIRVALATAGPMRRVLDQERPDAVHVATEGPIGWAMRRACLDRGLRFTTSYHTRFPEYIRARAPVPTDMVYGVLRRFHAPARHVLVSTEGMRRELEGHGFANLAIWPRGVDTALFRPDRPRVLDLPRPIHLTVSRLAVEKNLPAFLSLDLPGSKVVVGDGPQAGELWARFPQAHFLGMLSGEALADVYASADVFVFPSLTDTYGIVLLEALASGLPVAAYPVTGPRDVIGGADVGVLSNDLAAACRAARDIPRERCRAFAEARSWAAATDAFARHVLAHALPAPLRDAA